MNPTNRSTIFIALLVIINLSIGYFFTWSAYGQYEKTKRSLNGLTTDLDDLRNKQTLIKQLEQAEPRLSQQAAKARALVPVEEERQTFVSQIDQLAKTNQVGLLTFNFTPSATKTRKTTDDETDNQAEVKKTATKKESAKPLTFRATIIGPYANILSFIRQLESNERATALKTIDLTNSTDNLGASLTFEAAIYTKPAPKIPANMTFKEEDWAYLSALYPSQARPTGGRVDPFAPYATPTPVAEATPAP